MFHTGIQYTPVDSTATCLTLLRFRKVALQKNTKPLQILRERSEYGLFHFHFPAAGYAAPDTYADGLLVNIQTSATAV
jgi:hypothetical protein